MNSGNQKVIKNICAIALNKIITNKKTGLVKKTGRKRNIKKITQTN